MAARTVVALCRPCAGPHPPRNTDALLALVGAAGPGVSIVDVSRHDTFVEDARNDIVRDVLVCDDLKHVTHLLWIDDDMVPPRDALQKLLAHDLDIVGGLCHGRRPPSYSPILLYRDGSGYSYRYDYPAGLIEVDATGAAFLLVRRAVFERIEQAFPTPGEGPFSEVPGRHVGEDVTFCERAKSLGYKIHVDTTIDVDHLGEVAINSRTARLLRTAAPNRYVERPQQLAPGQPVASIVINTYNQRPEWLREAVRSALLQTVPTEVIVVDDGSEVEAARVLLPPFQPPDLFEQAGDLGRLRVTRIEHRGCYPALNEGIRHISTPWFCWLSSDDYFHPNKVEKQLAAMKAAGALASFHAYDFTVEGGKRGVVEIPPGLSADAVREALRGGCCINGLTVMIATSLLADLTELNGGAPFDERLDIVADYALWRDIAERPGWLALPDVLATRREHGQNDSVKFANDPEKRERWMWQHTAVQARYPKK